MSTPHEPGSHLVASLEPLTKAECWGLLATASVGRLGFVVNDRPEVLPLNYAIDGETILFRTAEDSVLNEASLRVVAFEVDHIDDAAHAGWSVLVQGLAQDIGDAVDPTSERLRRLALVTWAPGARTSWFRVDPDTVTGRRLRVVPDVL